MRIILHRSQACEVRDLLTELPERCGWLGGVDPPRDASPLAMTGREDRKRLGAVDMLNALRVLPKDAVDSLKYPEAYKVAQPV